MNYTSEEYIISLGDGWYADGLSTYPIIPYKKNKAMKFVNYDDAKLVSNEVHRILGYDCKIEKA